MLYTMYIYCAVINQWSNISGVDFVLLFDNQAVLVDMEEGVVNELLNGPLKDIFDHKQLITDVSGSGNNWYVELSPIY